MQENKLAQRVMARRSLPNVDFGGDQVHLYLCFLSVIESKRFIINNKGGTKTRIEEKLLLEK